MIPAPVQLLGVPIHPLHLSETVAAIDRRIRERLFTQHTALNVATLVQMRHDAGLRKAILASDIVNADGIGLVLGARFLGVPIPERVAGIDLFLELLALAEREAYPVYLLGARPEVIERAIKAIRQRFPACPVAGWHHGYFWEEEKVMVEAIRASGARLLFVAISSPLKERFLHRHRERLGVDFVMGVGGTFDVVAGVTRRAPLWMRRAGMEWCFRLFQEPRRLWRRYLVTNVIYGLLLAGARLRQRNGG